MIARVAEQCFWLHRYLERVEATARLLNVNVSFLLDTQLPELSHWRPILIVSGEHDRLEEISGPGAADDGEAVQAHMVWNESNPVSMWNSLRIARENARTMRDVISLETWTEVNAFWLWLGDREARKLFDRDRNAFYDRIRDMCRQISGTTYDTVLHDEAFSFMRLGALLERAGQTCRILDIKYHALGPTSGATETPAEAAHWLAILRSCSASEPFFKRVSVPPSGPAVAAFLLLEPRFPRAVMHCVTRAWHFVGRIRADGDAGEQSAALLQSLLRGLRSASVERLLRRGIHAELERIQQRVAEISDALRTDYFDAVANRRGAR